MKNKILWDLWRTIISHNKHLCVLCLWSFTMETEWKKDILMSTKLCISDKYFRKHSFSFNKTHFLLMGTHYHAAGLPWEALTIWSPFSKIPFITQVVDSSREWLIAPPAPQYQTFPVITQLYFTGSRVHCPSCVSSLVPWQAVGPCSPVWRGLSSVCLRQLRPTLPHFLPGSGDVDCDHHERHLQVEAAGVFRGIMRANERGLITSLPVSSGTPGSH